MTQTAIARPWRSGGLMSSRVACDIGISAAPDNPWTRRASTICGSDCARPHSAEASVKPSIEYRKILRRPKRPASQPESGVMIAAATMYEVSTHDIWSCVAERLPCMCGSATLAIVLSSACMIEASITDSVIRPRCGTSRAMPGIVAAAALIDSRLQIRAGQAHR